MSFIHQMLEKKEISLTKGISGLSQYNYSQYLHRKVEKIFTENKLSKLISHWNQENGLETRVSIYASYGVVKEGKFIIEPGSFIGRVEILKDKQQVKKILHQEIKDEVMRPIVDYLCKELLKPDDNPDLLALKEDWELEELRNSDLGHSSRLQIAPLKKEEEGIVAYYTEVTLLALGLGYSMRDFYDVGPFHLDSRLRPNGGIELDGFASELRIRTPLGSFKKWEGPDDAIRSKFLKKVKTKITQKETTTSLGVHYAPPKSIVVGTQGQPLPEAERLSKEDLKKQTEKESFREHKGKWKRLRDPVFLRVNELIKQWKA